MPSLALARPDTKSPVKPVTQLEELVEQLTALPPSKASKKSIDCGALQGSVSCLVGKNHPSHLVFIAPESLTLAAVSNIENGELGRNRNSNVTLRYEALPYSVSASSNLNIETRAGSQTKARTLLLREGDQYLFALMAADVIHLFTNISGKLQLISIARVEDLRRANAILSVALLAAPTINIAHEE